jgi:hypothetical protein
METLLASCTGLSRPYPMSKFILKNQGDPHLFLNFLFTDFGLETLGDLVEKTTFPWLMSNVIDNETGRPLADGKVTQT